MLKYVQAADRNLEYMYLKCEFCFLQVKPFANFNFVLLKILQFYASRAPKYEEEDIQSFSDENSSDAINLTDEAEFPKNSKGKIHLKFF